MLKLTHVYVLFRNSHLANDFNLNVNEPVRVEVKVYVDFATSLLTIHVPNSLTHKVSNNSIPECFRMRMS